MHSTARKHLELFLNVYASTNKENKELLEIGSKDFNGSIKSILPNNIKHVGIDIEHGEGVDYVLEDPYNFPIPSDKYDFVVATSIFEHAEFFWLSYLEMLRVLKPNGILYINAPSNARFHRYPKDYWRFYPDASSALLNWGIKNNYSESSLLESFIGDQDKGIWNDFVCVVLKDKLYKDNYPDRIYKNLKKFYNGFDGNSHEVINFTLESQDHLKQYSFLNFLKVNRGTPIFRFKQIIRKIKNIFKSLKNT